MLLFLVCANFENWIHLCGCDVRVSDNNEAPLLCKDLVIHII